MSRASKIRFSKEREVIPDPEELEAISKATEHAEARKKKAQVEEEDEDELEGMYRGQRKSILRTRTSLPIKIELSPVVSESDVEEIHVESKKRKKSSRGGPPVVASPLARRRSTVQKCDVPGIGGNLDYLASNIMKTILKKRTDLKKNLSELSGVERFREAVRRVIANKKEKEKHKKDSNLLTPEAPFYSTAADLESSPLNLSASSLSSQRNSVVRYSVIDADECVEYVEGSKRMTFAKLSVKDADESAPADDDKPSTLFPKLSKMRGPSVAASSIVRKVGGGGHFQYVGGDVIFQQEVKIQEVLKKHTEMKGFVIRPVDKFRAAVEKVIKTLRFQKGIFVVDTEANDLMFDKFIFRAKKHRPLNIREKIILQKEPGTRTEEELLLLNGLMETVGKAAFEKFTVNIQKALARAAIYLTVDKGHYILRQGDKGDYFYYISRGHVIIQMQYLYPGTDMIHDVPIRELGEGTTFGEIALLHDVNRTASVICKEDYSEFILIHRNDFHEILETETNMNALEKRLQVLNHLNAKVKLNFTPQEVETLSEHSLFIEYFPGQVLGGGLVSKKVVLQFIVSGECDVYRIVNVVKKRDVITKKVNTQLLRDYPLSVRKRLETGHRGKSKRIFSKPKEDYWLVGTVGPGYYHGTGENTWNTYLVAKSRVQVLEIPRHNFARHHRFRLLENMRAKIDAEIPTNNCLLTVVNENEDWKHYKKEVLKPIVEDRKSRRYGPNVTVRDVPKSIVNNITQLPSIRR